jgi:hypothetical protein
LKYIAVDGTSASAPALAGMLAALNEYRYSASSSRSTLGFVNPLLYTAYYNDASRTSWNVSHTLFNDVIEGTNRCLTYVCCNTAYLACRGFDPVTGLGTPNFYNVSSCKKKKRKEKKRSREEGQRKKKEKEQLFLSSSYSSLFLLIHSYLSSCFLLLLLCMYVCFCVCLSVCL